MPLSSFPLTITVFQNKNQSIKMSLNNVTFTRENMGQDKDWYEDLFAGAPSSQVSAEGARFSAEEAHAKHGGKEHVKLLLEEGKNRPTGAASTINKVTTAAKLFARFLEVKYPDTSANGYDDIIGKLLSKTHEITDSGIRSHGRVPSLLGSELSPGRLIWQAIVQA
jgi:hypothetical protein